MALSSLPVLMNLNYDLLDAVDEVDLTQTRFRITLCLEYLESKEIQLAFLQEHRLDASRHILARLHRILKERVTS